MRLTDGGARTAGFTTTLAQASIWIADQLRGRTSAYAVVIPFVVEGPVSRDALTRACLELSATVPALRLRMGLDRRGCVAQWFSAAPPTVEWVRADGADVADLIRSYVLDHPPNCDGGPLCEYLCVGVDGARTVVVPIIHHMVLDGVSVPVLVDQFFACLLGRATAHDPNRYRELVDRVRTAESRARTVELPYWTARLCDLRADWLPPQDSEGAAPGSGHHRGRVGGDALRRAHASLAGAGVSRFAITVGWVHQALRELGATDSVVCASTSTRPPDGAFDDVVGCFVNQVPLRCVDGERASFADLFRGNAPGWRLDLKHRHVPLMTLFDALAGEVEPSAVNRTLVSYRASQRFLVRGHGQTTVTTDTFNVYHEAKSELAVRFMASHDGLDYDLEWNGAHDPALGVAFRTALRQLVERPAE